MKFSNTLREKTNSILQPTNDTSVDDKIRIKDSVFEIKYTYANSGFVHFKAFYGVKMCLDQTSLEWKSCFKSVYEWNTSEKAQTQKSLNCTFQIVFIINTLTNQIEYLAQTDCQKTLDRGNMEWSEYLESRRLQGTRLAKEQNLKKQ